MKVQIIMQINMIAAFLRSCNIVVNTSFDNHSLAYCIIDKISPSGILKLSDSDYGLLKYCFET